VKKARSSAVRPARRGSTAPISALPPGDQKLVQIVDAAFADAARRSGPHLACRKGCTQCCIGIFAISQLDAARLREGMKELQAKNPERAAAVRWRAKESLARVSRGFPGDLQSGVLYRDPRSRRRFASFANREPCPALDPVTGLCDLYDARPMTCRVFGPPLRVEGGLGVCDLCYREAAQEEIVAAEIRPDPDGLEERLLRELEKETGKSRETIVAFALLDSL